MGLNLLGDDDPDPTVWMRQRQPGGGQGSIG